ncbi:hypothetical protein DPMN_074621 [Dreissena polymorpha]|uniref:Uncharacterized protein n=1 Tax=Dreissena polymorpha TaxID=45954 RepID=A0A9D4BLV9_DREPO|nr:hypothetical protein DPMN_074621 [Dreissena polymorpha]
MHRLVWSYAGHEALGDHMATRVVSGHTTRMHRLVWSYAGHETLGDHNYGGMGSFWPHCANAQAGLKLLWPRNLG